MNPNGQPLVADNLRRDLELRVRISSDERDALLCFCQANGITVADFVRARVFGFDMVESNQPPTRKPLPFVW